VNRGAPLARARAHTHTHTERGARPPAARASEVRVCVESVHRRDWSGEGREGGREGERGAREGAKAGGRKVGRIGVEGGQQVGLQGGSGAGVCESSGCARASVRAAIRPRQRT
jgi:hypothetical protein